MGGNLQLADSQFAYIDGSCEVNIPPGPITIEVSKGPEYRPLKQTIDLAPGKLAIRLAIERWIDLRKEGWYSADTRALYLPPHEALLEAGGEDLAIVNLLALETPNFDHIPAATPNLAAFSGSKPALEALGHQVVVNTLNCHPVLGTVALLNCHRVVYPLRFGGSEQDDAWSICDWCDQCHRRKNGLVIWSDLPRLRPDALQGEALAALLLKKIDAFEISYFDAPSVALADWYRLLDCVLCVPLVGGSGKESNAVALGAVRTYAHISVDQAPSFTEWTDAVRAGRTFVTNGPLLTLTVEGQIPGAIINLTDARKSVHFRAQRGRPFRLSASRSCITAKSSPAKTPPATGAKSFSKATFVPSNVAGSRLVVPAPTFFPMARSFSPTPRRSMSTTLFIRTYPPSGRLSRWCLSWKRRCIGLGRQHECQATNRASIWSRCWRVRRRSW